MNSKSNSGYWVVIAVCLLCGHITQCIHVREHVLGQVIAWPLTNQLPESTTEYAHTQTLVAAVENWEQSYNI